MRVLDNRPKVSRRAFVAGGGAAAILISGGALTCPGEAWGMQPKTLAPETMRTLIRMARDIYPHDRVADRYYAVALKGYDGAAAKDAKLKTLLEEGVAALDTLAKAKHGVGYADVGWEAERVALLEQIQSGAFFQKIRGGLVTGLYNQKEVWPVFGYEGESYSKGGYVNRGFDDIDWL